MRQKRARRPGGRGQREGERVGRAQADYYHSERVHETSSSRLEDTAAQNNGMVARNAPFRVSYPGITAPSHHSAIAKP